VVPLGLSLIIYAVAVVGSLAGAVARKQMLLSVGKPIATVALFAVLGGLPSDLHGYLIFSGVVLSLAADIALLADGREALVVGLALFLVAHLCYGFAFFDVGPGGWLAAPGLVIFGAGSLWLLRHPWHRLAPGLPVLVAVHGLTLACMMGGVFSLLAGQAVLHLSVMAAVGATLFYFSQALLPWARSRRASVWVQPTSLALYWGGQLCLVLAVRWGIGDKLVP
jgi:uncharacterized membrane protein YhhN